MLRVYCNFIGHSFFSVAFSSIPHFLASHMYVYYGRNGHYADNEFTDRRKYMIYGLRFYTELLTP